MPVTFNTMTDSPNYHLGPPPESFQNLYKWYNYLKDGLRGRENFTKEEAIEICHDHTCRANAEVYVEQMINGGFIVKD